MRNGALPLPKDALQLLHLKIQNSKKPIMRALLQDSVKQVHGIVYDDIDKTLVMKVGIKSKGGCGPSGSDPDNCRRILVYKSFSSCSLDLRKSFANFVKNLCITSMHTTNNVIESRLEAFISS